MIKTIIKEFFIMILLCIAIILILGVLFYDFIPTNKVVPNKIEAYVTPENIQTEIREEITELETAEVSYEITSSDLSLYKQSNSYVSYVPGKVDPFSASTSTEPEGEGNTTNNNETNTNSTNTNNSGSGSTTTDPNNTGTFFNNTGLK